MESFDGADDDEDDDEDDEDDDDEEVDLAGRWRCLSRFASVLFLEGKERSGGKRS